MAGAGSTLGKPKKAPGKGAPPAANRAAAKQAREPHSPSEVGPSRGKAAGPPGARAAAAGPGAGSAASALDTGRPRRESLKASEKGTPPSAGTPVKADEGIPLRTINSKNQFDRYIREAGERLVVIFFSGTWCETCQLLKPVLRQMAQINALVQFYEVNVDDSEDTAEACDIVHIPTFQFYKMGKKVAEVLDDSQESVEEKIKELK